MRNINELVGLINGISFDGVINKKEQDELKLWVDTNRNLLLEKREIELIKLIDTVLEDNIITDDEREMLVEYCNNFVRDMNGDPAIYILQGILTGIICDGEINQLEVNRLQDWMDNNRDYLSGLREASVLVETIDDVLEDGVITPEEQELLLKLLETQIEACKFETKLTYLKRQVKYGKNIGIDLIDLLDNEYAINEIHKKAELILKQAMMSYSGYYTKDVDVVFISLVIIAMMHYEDGRYYESVRETYRTLYDYYSVQKVEGTIRTVLNRYALDEDVKERKINAALYNAIVPVHYLSAFFEFIFDIYKLNFEYDLPEDLYDEFMFVYEGLRQNMLSDGDDVKINVTRKSYKLIKTTKQLIASENTVDAVIKLSIIIARIIDKRIWDKDITISNPYLKQGFEEWVEKTSDVLNGEKKERGESELRSRWEPKFTTADNNIYIVPPIHRIKACYDYWTINVVVENDGEVLYQDDRPIIKEIIGGYQVKVDAIRIDKPLGTLTYKLLSGTEVIYSSREKLYREVIAFDTSGKEISNNSDFKGTALICHKDKCDSLEDFYSSKNYKIAAYSAKLGDSLFINGFIFNFSSLAKPGIFGEEQIGCYVSKQDSDEKIKVFKEAKYVVFESIHTDAIFEMVVDGKPKKLNEENSKVQFREGVVRYVVDLDVLQSGVHVVSVYEHHAGRRNIISSFIFAVDSSLRIEVEPTTDENYLVSVESALLNDVYFKEVTPANYSLYDICFEEKSYKYNYILPFNFSYYAFKEDELKWHSLSEPLWIGDIKADTTLCIADNEVTELKVYGTDGSQIEEDIPLTSKKYTKEVNLGFLNSYRNNNDYFMLVFTSEGIRKNVAICYCKCILGESSKVEYNPVTEDLELTPIIYGKGNVFYSVTNSKGHVVDEGTVFESNDTIFVENLKTFERYTVTFYEKKKGLALLSLQNEEKRILGKFEKFLCNWDEIVGKTFKLSGAYFDQLVRGEFVRKFHHFNKSYVRILRKLDDEAFEGEIYTSTLRGNFDLYNINPVRIEICGDAVDDEVEVSITKDGDGLLIDFEYHSIMNSLDDPDAVDIYLLVMNLKGIEFV